MLEIADTSKDNLPQEEQEASEKEDPHMYERALLYIIKECQKLHVDLSYNILDSLKNNGDIIMQSSPTIYQYTYYDDNIEGSGRPKDHEAGEMNPYTSPWNEGPISNKQDRRPGPFKTLAGFAWFIYDHYHTE